MSGLTLGDDLRIANRLGFGAMRLTGAGIWGEPDHPDEARAVLRRALELGVTMIDTADSYGPEVSERLIGETLYPYPDGLVIATKAGFERSGPGRWHVNGRPEHLRAACEGSLRRLRVERIDLYQLHRIDRDVPLADQLGTLAGDAADPGDVVGRAPRGEHGGGGARARRRRLRRAHRGGVSTTRAGRAGNPSARPDPRSSHRYRRLPLAVVQWVDCVPPQAW